MRWESVTAACASASDVNNAADTMTGGAQLLRVILLET